MVGSHAPAPAASTVAHQPFGIHVDALALAEEQQTRVEEHRLGVAHHDHGARQQGCGLADEDTVDLGAVRAACVLYVPARRSARQHCMDRRQRGIGNEELVALDAAHAHHAERAEVEGGQVHARVTHHNDGAYLPLTRRANDDDVTCTHAAIRLLYPVEIDTVGRPQVFEEALPVAYHDGAVTARYGL